MPRYFFHRVSTKRAIQDKRGVELIGPEAAHWHGVQLIYQTRYHLPDANGNWFIRIEDITGKGSRNLGADISISARAWA
jgi:hypothetical protein